LKWAGERPGLLRSFGVWWYGNAELFAVMRDMASEAVTEQVTDGKLDQATDEHTEGEELSKRLAESQARLASFQDRMLVMEKEKGKIPSETGEDARDAELAKEAKNLAEDEEEDAETKICKQLFKGLKFFLGREVCSIPPVL
jgi:predicted nuclease with TOPRIM domain